MVLFDGTRAICYLDKVNNEVRFLNRRGIYFEKRYPELKGLIDDVKGEKVILDGEIVVFKEGKPDFPSLQTREHVDDYARIEILSKILPATFVAFDILHLNGEDLIDLPLIKRKKILEDVVKESNRIILSPYVIGKGKNFFEECKKKGLEGIMAKRLDSKYEIGKRSKEWLKIKFLKSLDCIVIGFTEGTGWREKYFGSLLCGIYFKKQLKYLGRVGTGFNEEDLIFLTKLFKKIETGKCPIKDFEDREILEKIHWVRPKYVVEVCFMNLTEDLKFRAPSFKKIRFDKTPEECILEESELKFYKA